MNPLRGTILVGFRRARFVVLAADRLSVAGNPEHPDEVRYDNKIAVHPKLPLAIAVSGLGGLVNAQYPEVGTGYNLVTDLLTSRVFPLLEKEAHLRPDRLAKRIKQIILPELQNQRRYLMEKQAPDSRSVRHIDLVVAIAPWGKAKLLQLQLTDEIAQRERREALLLCPQDLCDYFRSQIREEAYGTAIRDPNGLLEHAAFMVDEGIEFESLLARSENPRIGGGVDLALVDEDGVHQASGIISPRLTYNPDPDE